jgi:hypothetical protein
MRSAPIPDGHKTSEIKVTAEPAQTSSGFVRRAGAFVMREFDEIWPPTLFFIIGFH